MNRKTTLLSYLALLIIFITLDSAHARIKSHKKRSSKFKEDWTENEMVTVKKFLESSLKINREKNPTIVELRDRKGSYSEMFTIDPQNQTIGIKNNYGEVFFDLLKNVTTLRSSRQPKRLINITIPNSEHASLKNERGELAAYYENSSVSCDRQSSKVSTDRRYVSLEMGKFYIEYNRETNVVKISDENNSIMIDIAKRSIEVKIDGKPFTVTQTWISNNNKIFFENNVCLIIKYGVYELTISLPGGSHTLFLRAPHVNLTESQSKVFLDCEAGNAEMTLKDDGTVEEIALASTFGQEEGNGNGIDLSDDETIIYGAKHLVTIKKLRKKATRLSLATKLAHLKVLPKK